MNIIGDIAGRYYELLLLLEKLPKSNETIFVGDLNDRGPKSKDVIEFIMNTPNFICIQSNHGDMFVDFYEGINRYHNTDFLSNGGIETLKSYNCEIHHDNLKDIINDVRKKVPKDHIEWLKNLPYYYENDNIFISHAAKNPVYKLEDLCINSPNSLEYNLLWNRGKPRKIEGKLQVMGHNSHWGVKKFGNRDNPWAICIDGSRKNRLTGLHVPTMKIYHQNYINL